MSPIHVLISTRVTLEQLDRMRAIHPRLAIDGEPGGIAIMAASEVDYKGIDYPEERPDLDVAKLLGRAEVIIATRIPASLKEQAHNLRWIQFTSAGIDHLWKPFLDTGDVVVTSAKGIHAIPMAEFVLSGLLMFAKGWPRLLDQKRGHAYQKFVVDELYDKTLVLLGVGAIGGAIAQMAKPLRMHVVGVRRREGTDGLPPEIQEVVPIRDLRQALVRADFVVASLPLTARSRHLVDEAAFRAMKPSAVFVNVGRGRTVDESALVRALREGWISGAVLDVYEHEPLPADSPLWGMPNALLSPHMGSDTPRYMERMTDILCDNLRRYAEGRPLRNVVDPVERY
jgi:phosphoglycerate dehydrogenase-like enzyme